MSDGKMKYTIEKNMMFPIVEVELDRGESIHLQPGSMIYHSDSVELGAKLNGKGKGIGKFFGAVGRALTSGESMFITDASSKADGGKIALAPVAPGCIIALELGDKQYCLNDGAFLAMDGGASYSMKSQSVGKAIFGGTGGFFVMTTEGTGTLLCNAFGSIKKLELDGDSITIDNTHVLAWSSDLDYDIHLENGFFQSMGTGEGVVNTFSGHGEIYVQSLNLETFASLLKPYLPQAEKDD